MAGNPKRNATRPLSIGIIDGSKIPTSMVDRATQKLSVVNIWDDATKRRLAGYALSTIREHGVKLNSWDTIEIDVTALENATHSLDVHFLTQGNVTHGMLGLIFDSLQRKATGFDVIAIQPKRKYQC